MSEIHGAILQHVILELIFAISRRTFSTSLLGGAAALVAQNADDFTSRSLAEISARIHARTVTPSQLVTACLSRIDTYNPKINAFITVLHEQALAEAKQLDEEQRAEVARRLKLAGAMDIGKANLHEFAFGGTSATSYFGPVRNPWALERAATRPAPSTPPSSGKRTKSPAIPNSKTRRRSIITVFQPSPIPCVFTSNKLPIGLMIAGPRFSEGRVLALARAYQRATDLHEQQPPNRPDTAVPKLADIDERFEKP